MWCTSLLPAQDITFSWCILYWLSHLCFLQDASRNHCNYQLHCSRLRTHGCYHCCCWHLGKIRPRKAQGLWADARRCVDLPGYAENQNSIQVTQCSAYSGLWLQDKIKKLHRPPRTPLHKSQTNYKAWYSHFPVFWDENFWNGWNNLIHTSARCLCSAQGRGTALKGSSRLSGGTGRTWCAIACLLKPQPKDGTRGTQGSARRGTPHEKWADVWHKS